MKASQNAGGGVEFRGDRKCNVECFFDSDISYGYKRKLANLARKSVGGMPNQ